MCVRARARVCACVIALVAACVCCVCVRVCACVCVSLPLLQTCCKRGRSTGGYLAATVQMQADPVCMCECVRARVRAGVCACVCARMCMWQVNLLGGYPAAIAQMETDGIKRDQIPDWMGGGSKGLVTKQFLETLLKENGV